MLYTHEWAPSVGGIQTVYMCLARGLSQWPKTHAGEAVEVTLVTRTRADGMDDSQLPFHIVRRPRLRELIQHIRSADIVHVAGPALLTLIIGWLLRKPTIIEHHGYQSNCPNGLLLYGPDHAVCPGHFMARNYRKCIQCNSGSLGRAKSFWSLALTFPRRWLAGKAAVNVVPSHHIGRRIGLPRTQAIYHGVPGQPIPRRSAAGKDDLHPGCFAYVGRLVTEKGLPVLLQACSQLSQRGYDFRVKIVGDGPERPRLEKIADELGLKSRTEFLGSVDQEAIGVLLTGITAVVMPSVCEDVAPLVAIEQMMQGRLIIASDIGGLGEIVDGVGLKFPPGDWNGLESCMRQVLENPNLAEELGERAQRHASQVFAEERMVAEHLYLYQKLVRPWRE